MPVNSGDTAWILVSTALVMLMTPGLALVTLLVAGGGAFPRRQWSPITFQWWCWGRACSGSAGSTSAP